MTGNLHQGDLASRTADAEPPINADDRDVGQLR